MSKLLFNKEKKRAAILNAAYDFFTKQGFSKTTILNIALKAGVGKGTFYLYFDSKEDVRDTLIAIKSSELLLGATDSLSASDSKANMTFADKIIYVADFIISNLSKNISLLKFISKYLSWGLLANSENVSKDKEDRIVDFKSFFLNIISEENINIKNPELMIFTILELINSTCYSVILYNQPVKYDDYKPYLHKTIRLIIENSMEQ